MTTFEAIADDYVRRWRGIADEEKRAFATDDSLREPITRAGMAQDHKGKRFSHQRRIPRAVLRAWTGELLGRGNELKGAATFHELFVIVADCRIAGIGSLCIYDTALRIGAFRKLEPDFVYLHAGTREGARTLGLATGEWLSRADLPAAFRRLSAAEIEDCLCLYKDELAVAASKM